MKLETLTVELRPRSPWEAMELGSALVRKHARAIWIPWLLVTGAVFVLLNLAAWAIGHIWLAGLLFWWLRPAFDRIPLYVLSRAVFGSVPSIAETLRAQLTWGWRPMRGYLTWRRLSPLRAVMLPIDLLEGADPARLGERRRVIGVGLGGHAVQLFVMCANFILAIELSLLLLTAIAVPNELLPEAARAAWAMITEAPPAWALIALNLVDWLAAGFIEPFYIGAGFGLYLNRRTQLEAWDLEIAFRRMRKRLEAAGGAIVSIILPIALLAFVLLLPMAMPAQASEREDGTCPFPDKTTQAKQSTAQTSAGAPPIVVPDAAKDAQDDNAPAEAAAEPEAQIETSTLEEIFGEDTADHGAFGKAVGKAYQDPLLRPKQKTTTWERRDKKKDKEPEAADVPQLKWLAALVGFVAEYGLWFLLGVLVLMLAITAKRWWPWLLGAAAKPEDEPMPVEMTAISHTEPLPPDIATVARRLWAEGQPRRALALLYRASVEAMSARVDAHLPPGATEAECLRLSRRMPVVEDRDAFQRMVRIWQYAAYGQRLPTADEFDALLQTLAQRFGWQS
ncbi:MAG: DUF4129 domain-containing protein [Lysobacter sp.]|nr:DUF4129 domain-containing protein [Lysobacter sp.]